MHTHRRDKQCTRSALLEPGSLKLSCWSRATSRQSAGCRRASPRTTAAPLRLPKAPRRSEHNRFKAGLLPWTRARPPAQNAEHQAHACECGAVVLHACARVRVHVSKHVRKDPSMHEKVCAKSTCKNTTAHTQWHVPACAHTCTQCTHTCLRIERGNCVLAAIAKVPHASGDRGRLAHEQPWRENSTNVHAVL